jgi:hypothetical protein
MKAISGTWLGEQGVTFALLFPDVIRWSCVCFHAHGDRPGQARPGQAKAGQAAMIELSFDEELGYVWWGKNKAFFVKGAEVVDNRHWARWYARHAPEDELTGTQKPSFVWSRQEADSPEHQARQACVAEAAEKVTKEIMRQLIEQGGEGRVVLPNWNEEYRGLLGPLREFLEAQPDRLVVSALTTDCSRKYTVAVVEPSASAELDATRRCLAKFAVREVTKQLTEPGNVGVVSLPDWKETFSPHLGTLRSFLGSRPEFVIIPGRGSKFRVVAAGALPS